MFFTVLLVLLNCLRVALRVAKRQLEAASPLQVSDTLAARRQHVKNVIENNKSLEGAPSAADIQDLRRERHIESRNASRLSTIEKLRRMRCKDFAQQVATLQQAIDAEVGNTTSHK